MLFLSLITLIYITFYYFSRIPLPYSFSFELRFILHAQILASDIIGEPTLILIDIACTERHRVFILTGNCRNSWLVSSSCDPSSCRIRSKPATQSHNMNNNTTNTTPVTSLTVSKPVRRAKRTSCMAQAHTTNSSANHSVPQPQQGMNMILRSADRVTRYSLRQ